MNNQIGVGCCTLCGGKSVCVCQRCRDYYCSPICQKNDWHRHRYICFPMPALVPADQFFDTRSQHGDVMPALTAMLVAQQKATTTPPTTTTTAANQRNNYTKKNADNNSVASSTHANNATQNAKGKYEKMQTTTTDTVPNAVKPKANSKVVVTGFHSANRCYIRPSNANDNEIYQNILTKVDMYGRNAPQLNGMPALNSYVMVLKNNKWWRGKIINNQKGLKVLMIDLGISAQRFKNDLREISSEILALPLYPYMIQLNNVENYNKTEKFLVKCRDFEENEYRVEYIDNKAQTITAKLINTLKGKVLNDEINDFCRAEKVFGTASRHNISNNSKSDLHNSTMSINSTNSVNSKVEKNSIANLKNSDSSDDIVAPHDNPVKPIKSNVNQPKQVQTPVMNPPFQFRLFDAMKEDFPVIVMDTSCLELGYIGALLPSARENFNEIHEHLKKYKFNDLPSYAPKEDEYIVAKFKDDWFRAKVLEVIDNNEYSVVYIDFTNEANVTKAEVRRYPRDLTKDCFTNFCFIEGFPDELDANTLNKLKTFFNSKNNITIDRVLGKENNIVHIQCSMVTDQFKDKN